MATAILVCKVTLRPYMKPLLILAAFTGWRWLTDKCFKCEVLDEGQEAEISS